MLKALPSFFPLSDHFRHGRGGRPSRFTFCRDQPGLETDPRCPGRCRAVLPLEEADRGHLRRLDWHQSLRIVPAVASRFQEEIWSMGRYFFLSIFA